ncbi:MAG: nuclear transport factor 2 family protein [Bacteroidota bacterium]
MTTTQTDRATELRELVGDLNGMILQGQILEAHDKFYHDNCVQQESETDAREGKAVNREFEEAFVGGLTEFRGAEVKSVAVDAENDTTMVEWFMDYTHKDWGDKTYHQVAVQRWSGDKIVHERYYSGG